MAKPNSILSRIPWEEAYISFLALEQKKQLMVGASALLVLLLIILVPISCASRRLGKMENEYLNSQKNLVRLAQQVQAYTDLKGSAQALDASIKRNKNASLSTVLEGLANDVGIGKNINSLKPRKISSNDAYEEQGLDVQLREVSLQNITDYLQKIESSPRLRMKVSKVQIKPKTTNRSMLDVTFQVSTLIPKETP